MTREKMAERLHSLSGFAHASEFDVLSSAAAELRKTCATCKYFMKSPLDQAVMACSALYVRVPSDGSGFCHRWEAKQ